MSLFKLFLIFVKIGAILLGGGYVILPIMTSEFVEKRNLVSHDDMIDYFALSQSLPGLIAANISMFIGYKLKGKFGAIAAMAGITFVPFSCIVLLASVLNTLVNNSYVQGALWGVGVAVIALIMLTVREMWQKSNKNWYFYIVFVLTLGTLIVFKLSPIQTILLFTILGVGYKRFAEVRK
ncbi:MAG: chromate transporter [Candidatus Gastranaerophilales bacterium]|nr:chromate transporter [Candidatus Gastranaerophilales bacterium]MCM1072652.1 chromate transporter [Bacteroides sp.]